MSQFHSNIAPKPFTFTPATQADIPRLTHIHLVTLAEDPPAQINFPSAENFAAAVSSMLEKQIGDPNWRIMKAVDEETGEIGSWASWLTHDASDSHPKPDPRPEEEGNGEDNNRKGEDEGKFHFAPGLGSHIMNHTNTLYASFSNTQNFRSHLSLRACFTLLEFERRGMATSLIAYGAKRADEMGVWTLVQASLKGKTVYEKNGYEVWDWLDIELGDEKWIGCGEGEVERFRRGTYRVWYLARKPKQLRG